MGWSHGAADNISGGTVMWVEYWSDPAEGAVVNWEMQTAALPWQLQPSGTGSEERITAGTADDPAANETAAHSPPIP